MAIHQNTLRSKAQNYSYRLDESQFTDTYSKKRFAFLCHSHKDEQLVKGLIVLFRESGVELYVDWMDEAMPETPNKETAAKIQARIIKADLFIFLATQNSQASRWCPWEIGYADGVNKKIYIVPTKDDYSTYGNEYLQLYKHIDTASSNNSYKTGYGVFDTSGSGNWLTEAAMM